MKRKISIISIFLLLLISLISFTKIEVNADEAVNFNEEENSNLEINQEIEKTIMLDETNLLLQQKIDLKSKSNDILDNTQEIYINAPKISEKIPENVIIMENGKLLDTESYNYNKEQAKVTINRANTLSENKESDYFYRKYQIIYEYSNMDLNQQKVQLSQEVQLYVNACTKLNEEEKITENNIIVPLELKGEKVSLNELNKQEIYKGYMYQAEQYETKYKQNYNIEISTIKDVNEIRIKDLEKEFTYYEKNGDDIEKTVFSADNAIYYTQTKISKEEFLRYFGEVGKIQILDDRQNILAEITKDTQEDEDGNIVIDYGENRASKIEIITTKPIEVGTVNIEHTKVIIPQTGYSKEEISQMQYLEENIEMNNAKINLKNELKEPYTQIDFSINKDELTTIKNNENVELMVTLKANNETTALYNNPEINITFPEQVKNITLKDNANILYNQELKIKDIELQANMKIILEGEQTKYSENAIEGATIALKMDLELDKKAVNQKGNITVQCKNGQEEINEQKEINISSPREIITVNNINDLGIETIGEESVQEAKLENNSAKKQVQVQTEIINNKGSKIEDMSIIGTIPTDGNVIVNGEEKENNLGAKLTNLVTVPDKEAQIYYTENAEATADLENILNGWDTQVQDISKVKKYLVKISNVENAEDIKVEYNLEIPEGLVYNKEAYQGYEVIYQNQERNIENTATSTYIKMTTGKGPEVSANLNAYVGVDEIAQNEIVKIGEMIKYKITLTNTGTEKAENVKIQANIPEGTVLKQLVIGPDDTYIYEEVDTDIYENTLETLEIGETKTIEYEIQVKEIAETTSDITSIIKLQYDNVEKEIASFTNKVEEANLEVEFLRGTNKFGDFESGSGAFYLVNVKNISDSTQENVKVEINVPNKDIATIDSIQINMEEQENIVQEDNKPVEVMLGTLEKDEEKTIRIGLVSAILEENTEITLSAKAIDSQNNIYRANTYTETIYANKVNLTMTATHTNEYVKTDDIIDYKITIQNEKSNGVANYNFDLTIPEDFSIIEIKKDGEIDDLLNINDNSISIMESMEEGQTIVYEIRATVNYSDVRLEDKEVQTNASISLLGVKIEEVNITHYVQKEDNNQGGGENPDNPGEIENTYTIQGKIWKDENNNGGIDDNEETLPNVPVMLLDTSNNQLVKDNNGNNLTATTDENGIYFLNNVKEGDYIVVFKYDTSRYKLTTYMATGIDASKNSKAIMKKYNLGEGERNYGVTDIISVTDRSISNINMGLIQIEEFDIKLDKTITKISVQNGKNTRIYNYNNAQLAKVELDAKTMNNSIITIEYNIKVSNIGKIDGYVRNIVDYKPQGLEFEQDLNPGWYEENGELYTENLANEKISVGETKSVTLLLTKKIEQGNVGAFTNIAEVYDAYNEEQITDINSTPGNKKENENDMSKADVIISIKTGTVIMYTSLIISTIVILGVGIYFIRKKVLGVNK